MKRYAITQKAGRFVAGRNNTGVGSVLVLAEREARHEVRLGTLVDLEAEAPKPKPKTAKRAEKKTEDAQSAADGA